MKKWILVIVLPMVISFGRAQSMEKHGVANEELPTGLNVGDTIADLNLNFLDGSVQTLYEFSDERPTVIMFYRGEWCPVCNKYLNNLTDSLSMIQEKANVIVISPETKENMIKTSESYPEYTYVLDEDEDLMTAFDVAFDVTKKYQKKIKLFLRTDIAEHNGEEKARLPVPATFIVDSNGVILFKQFDYDYSVRATAAEILKHL